jgi:hypothetical protein
MRSQTKDQAAQLVLGAYVVDAASGAGMFAPYGIPWWFTRTGTGIYVVGFPSRLIPLWSVVTPEGQSEARIAGPVGAGGFTVVTYSGTGVPTNSNFCFEMGVLRL